MATELAPIPTTTVTVKLWDADFNLAFDVDTGWRIDEPEVLAVPQDTPIARWLLEDDRASFDSAVFLTAWIGGRRWTGRLKSYTLAEIADFQGKYLEVRFEREVLRLIDFDL